MSALPEQPSRRTGHQVRGGRRPRGDRSRPGEAARGREQGAAGLAGLVGPGEAVLVVGLAVTGAAVARHLLGAGIPVVAVDDRPGPECRSRAASLGIPLVEAPSALRLGELAKTVGLVVVSPGVPIDHPALALPAPAISEVEIAGRLAAAAGLPVVGVTGTNGKTTVTTIVAEMLVASGRRAVAAGNIGVPLVDVVAGDAVAGLDVVVAELSSFQLAFTERFRPQVGVWLNLTEDHLDWHKTLAHYEAAKARVWARQGAGDVAVVNLDDPVVSAWGARAPAEWHLTYGLSRGAYHEADGWLRTPGEEGIIPVGELWRALPHDRSNALAACAAALAAGADLPACRRVLSTFGGLHHRIEVVGEAGGVRWLDDSKATTPASVAAALVGFSSVVLIAGGRNKGLRLEALGAHADRVRAVVAIGEAAPEVEQAFAGTGASVARAASMAEAVDAADRVARSGDVVLLSPGCASFDWYNSYAERGRDFAREVRRRLRGRRGG